MLTFETMAEIEFSVECECGNDLKATAVTRLKGSRVVEVEPCQGCIDAAVADAKDDWMSEQ